MKDRKLKSKQRKRKGTNDDDYETQFYDKIEYGEVVDRPPEFKVIPKAKVFKNIWRKNKFLTETSNKNRKNRENRKNK